MSLMEYSYVAPPSLSLRDALMFTHDARKARWRPGSRAAHSSVGPALVAQVIEKATGQRFEDYVTQSFFEPMGMKSATYFEPSADFAGQHATDGVTALPYWNHLFRPVGALNVSVEDMAKYLMLLLDRGVVDTTRIVSSAAIERLERPETLDMTALGIKVAPGPGMLNTLERGFHFRGHFGIVNGGLAEVMYLPDRRSGIVMLMNSMNERARYRVLNVLMSYVTRGASRPAAATPAPIDPKLIEDFAGYYLEDSPTSERMRVAGDFTGVMQVSFTANEMAVRNQLSRLTERWIADNVGTFKRKGDTEAMLAMFRSQEGELVMQSKWGTYRKVPALRALAPLVIGGVCVLLMLTALVAALVWLVRVALRRPPKFGSLWVRSLPVIASALFFLTALVAASAMNLQGLWGPWGRPTLPSIAAWLIGVTFAALSLLSVILVTRHRHTMGRIAYWHASMVSVACVIAASYLTFRHLIIVPTWYL
jgi:hypothetical protein